MVSRKAISVTRKPALKHSIKIIDKPTSRWN
jgi:hypothetical protein